METINKVELAGHVGSVLRKTVGDSELARFSLCTNRISMNGEYPVVETSWHDCHAFASDNIDLTRIEKGAWLHIVGRLKYTKYVDVNNVEKQVTEIVVTRIIECE